MGATDCRVNGRYRLYIRCLSICTSRIQATGAPNSHENAATGAEAYRGGGRTDRSIDMPRARGMNESAATSSRVHRDRTDTRVCAEEALPQWHSVEHAACGEIRGSERPLRCEVRGSESDDPDSTDMRGRGVIIARGASINKRNLMLKQTAAPSRRWCREGICAGRGRWIGCSQ